LPDNQFSFTVFGDSRSYSEKWQIISEATLDTDFTLFLGDIVSKGYSQADWDNWFKYGEKFISREPNQSIEILVQPHLLPVMVTGKFRDVVIL